MLDAPKKIYRNSVFIHELIVLEASFSSYFQNTNKQLETDLTLILSIDSLKTM